MPEAPVILRPGTEDSEVVTIHEADSHDEDRPLLIAEDTNDCLGQSPNLPTSQEPIVIQPDSLRCEEPIVIEPQLELEEQGRFVVGSSLHQDAKREATDNSLDLSSTNQQQITVAPNFSFLLNTKLVSPTKLRLPER